MKKRVGLIGLGLMGAPMARNWIKKGFELTVLPNRNKAVAEELKKEGAKIADSLVDLAHESDVICLMVPTSVEVEKLTLGAGGLENFVTPNHLIIDMSTSDPASTEKIHRAYNKKGLRFFDSPVTGGVKGATHGTLTLFIGGPELWVREAHDVLAAVSAVQSYFGEASKGHVAKIINNYICVGNLAVFCEALPLAVSAGLDAQKMFDTLLSGTGSSEMLKAYGPQILEGDFAPRFKLGHAHKDLRLAHDLAQQHQARLPVLDGMLEDFARAHEANLDEKNLSALILPIEERLKATFRK